MKNETPKQPPANFPTAELSLITYLNLRGIIPIGRTLQEDGRYACLFARTTDLEAAIIDYSSKCPVCGVEHSGLPLSQANARKQLLDGDWDWKRGQDDMKRGVENGNRR